MIHPLEYSMWGKGKTERFPVDYNSGPLLKDLKEKRESKKPHLLQYDCLGIHFMPGKQF